MPEPQQRLIFFCLFLATASATTISSFGAEANLGIMGNTSTIYANMVELWADVTDCPEPACKCDLQTNATDNIRYTLKFLDRIPNWGSAKVQSLNPYTPYSFTLTCEGQSGPVSETRVITTDAGRPSNPQNIAVALDGKRVKVTWAAPKVPAGPINLYRIKVDKKEERVNKTANELSYEMPDDYVAGVQHTFVVQACNQDRSEHLFCSLEADGVITYGSTETTTTSTTTVTTTTEETTTTTPKSIGIQASSVSIILISACLFLFHLFL